MDYFSEMKITHQLNIVQQGLELGLVSLLLMSVTLVIIDQNYAAIEGS